MARKAPKNPINDIVDTVGAWFGGRGPGTNPQVSRVSRDLGRAVSAADTVTGGFGAAALRDVKNFQQGGSLPTNLAKTTAVNLVAGAVGAKAAQVAGRAVVASGVAKRAVQRTFKRDEVLFMHGSPQRGLTEIKPQLPPEATKIRGSSKGMFEGQEIDPLTWGTMVSHPSPTGKTQPVWKATRETLTARAEKAYEYTGRKMSPNRTGSLYIAKVSRKGVEDYGDEMITPSVAKVVREIDVRNKSREQVYQEALKELKGLGMKIPKSSPKGPKKK